MMIDLRYSLIPKKKKNKYLALIEPFDGDTIAVRFVDGNVSIPELTMAQQLPDAILVVEVFGVSKLGTLPARD